MKECDWSNRNNINRVTLFKMSRCRLSPLRYRASWSRFYSTQSSSSTVKNRRWLLPTFAFAGVAIFASFASFCLHEDIENSKTGEFESQLPTFSMQQVQQQSTWVVYRHGVYDVEKFAGNHPGGTKILQAAGKSVEMFWQQSEPHSRAGVRETLEKLRIGNLRDEDFDKMEKSKEKQDDALHKVFFTEGADPDVDLDVFELKISGLKEGEEMALSLNELKTRFKQHQVTTTIRCATPRGEKAVVRVPAEWAGVLLVDVLASAGIKMMEDIEQVRFEALDTDSMGRAFGASIPAATAMDRTSAVLLAYEMNGAPIPKEHGFPLRVVVPGTTGARNVKFVHRVIIT